MISKSAGREPQSFVSFYSEVSAFLGLRNNGNRLFPISFPREFLEAGVLFYELAANVWCSVAWDIRHCAGGQRTISLGSANQRLVLVDLVCGLGPLPRLNSFFSPTSLHNFGSEVFCFIINEELGLGEHGFSQRSIAGDWRRWRNSGNRLFPNPVSKRVWKRGVLFHAEL